MSSKTLNNQIIKSVTGYFFDDDMSSGFDITEIEDAVKNDDFYNSEIIKDHCDRLMVLSFSDYKDNKILKIIEAYIENLFNSFNSMFSLFFKEIINYHKAEIKYFVFYKLRSNINVYQFYSFARILIGFIETLDKTDLTSVYCKFFDYDDYLKEQIKKIDNQIKYINYIYAPRYCFFNTSFCKDKQNLDFLISCLFFCNGLFDEYVKNFSLTKVINAIASEKTIKNYPEFHLLDDYLEKHIIYIFTPIIIDDFVPSFDFTMTLDNIQAILVSELIDPNEKFNLKPSMSVRLFKNLNNQIVYDLNDYKDSISSDYKEVLSSDNYLMKWHMKPFYISFYTANKKQKIPAIAIEVMKNK